MESTLAIASLVYFISSSSCELAIYIYYHCPLTEKETKAQRVLLICPRSQLVCGCADVQMLLMESLTPGLSCYPDIQKLSPVAWTGKGGVRAESGGGDTPERPDPWVSGPQRSQDSTDCWWE